MLYQWADASARFVKVAPRDYERVLAYVAQAEAAGRDRGEALTYAFDKMREA